MFDLVYGKNTNSGLYDTQLQYKIYRVGPGDTIDITNQFPSPNMNDNTLVDDEIINQRVTNGTGITNKYYIWAKCSVAASSNGCDGTFTVSSWY